MHSEQWTEITLGCNFFYCRFVHLIMINELHVFDTGLKGLQINQFTPQENQKVESNVSKNISLLFLKVTNSSICSHQIGLFLLF